MTNSLRDNWPSILMTLVVSLFEKSHFWDKTERRISHGSFIELYHLKKEETPLWTPRYMYVRYRSSKSTDSRSNWDWLEGGPLRLRESFQSYDRVPVIIRGSSSLLHVVVTTPLRHETLLKNPRSCTFGVRVLTLRWPSSFRYSCRWVPSLKGIWDSFSEWLKSGPRFYLYIINRPQHLIGLG